MKKQGRQVTDPLSPQEIMKQVDEQNWLWMLSEEERTYKNVTSIDKDTVKERIRKFRDALGPVIIQKKLPGIFGKVKVGGDTPLGPNAPFRIFASGSFFWCRKPLDAVEIDVIVDGHCPFSGPHELKLDEDEMKKLFQGLDPRTHPVTVSVYVFGSEQLESAAGDLDVLD